MLQVVEVEKHYVDQRQQVPVLRGVSFNLARGAFCALLGPSGSGKSTLMNIVGLLDQPTRGQVILDGAVVSGASPDHAAWLRNRQLGFVFQSFQLLARLTAWENVALPLLYRGAPKDLRRDKAMAMLEQVGLQRRAHARPAELSGGQRQRVAVARALVGEPKLILADEPTGSLDSQTAADVMALLRTLNRRLSVTVLMVTHDRALADQCDRRIEILDGRIVRDLSFGVS